ncbi:MAG: OmpA family protein, partial [Alphaproteobacteria bacterium]|nr:OmpA family protein [Alphaproteobacteria bacterium]
DDIAARLQADGAVDLYGLYFDFGSANLRAESRPVLDQIAAFARAHPGQSLLIEGHTDSVGGKDANLRLSQARADAVLAALGKQGVSAAQLTSRGYGADQPVANNATTAGRASNRRVTLRLQGQAS